MKIIPTFPAYGIVGIYYLYDTGDLNMVLTVDRSSRTAIIKFDTEAKAEMMDVKFCQTLTPKVCEDLQLDLMAAFSCKDFFAVSVYMYINCPDENFERFIKFLTELAETVDCK